MKSLVSVVALVGLIASCGDDGGHTVGGDGGPGSGSGSGIDAGPDGRTDVLALPAEVSRDLDILFMVDDSVSMTDKQNNLVTNFPRFIDALNTLPGGFPNLHLAVITSDMGTSAQTGEDGAPIGITGNGGCSGKGKNGAFQTNGALTSGSYLVDLNGGTTKNFAGDLSAAFATMATVGAHGCGFEQPLAAIKAALDGRNADSEGFLRPTAHLLVVLLTDEDDCSLHSSALIGSDATTFGPLQSFRCTRFGVLCSTNGATTDAMNEVGAKAGCHDNTGSPYVEPVGTYRDFLANLKGDARAVTVELIGGDPTPVSVALVAPGGSGDPIPALAHSCTYTGGDGNEVADPAVRLYELAQDFPNHNAFVSVCQPNLADSLNLLGQVAIAPLGDPCIATPLADADPNTAGTQYDCEATDVTASATTVIPACDASDTPTCFEIASDLQSCTAGDHLELVIHRPSGTTVDPTTITYLRCKV